MGSEIAFAKLQYVVYGHAQVFARKINRGHGQDAQHRVIRQAGVVFIQGLES